MPLAHPAGHAQADFGGALAIIGGVERKIHFLAMSLPHSDACFVEAYPGEPASLWDKGILKGHRRVETQLHRLKIIHKSRKLHNYLFLCRKSFKSVDL